MPSALAEDLRELIDTVRSLYTTTRGPLTGKAHRSGRWLVNDSAEKIDLRGLAERVWGKANAAGLGHYFRELRGWGRCRLPAVELTDGVQFVVYADDGASVLDAWLAVAERLLSEVEDSMPAQDSAPAATEPPEPLSAAANCNPHHAKARRRGDVIDAAMAHVSEVAIRHQRVPLVKEVAEAVGCHPKYLSSNKRFREWRDRFLTNRAGSLLRGRKENGVIEAELEREKDDDE